MKWIMNQRGKHWQYKRENGSIAGFVNFHFCTWEGFVCTGKKWPIGDLCVCYSGSFWHARKCVETDPLLVSEPKIQLGNPDGHLVS